MVSKYDFYEKKKKKKSMQDLRNRLGWQRGNYHDHTFPHTSLRIKLHSGVSICALSLSLSLVLPLCRWHFLTLKMNEGWHASVEENGTSASQVTFTWTVLFTGHKTFSPAGREETRPPATPSEFMISSFLNTFSWMCVWIKSSSSSLCPYSDWI